MIASADRDSNSHNLYRYRDLVESDAACLAYVILVGIGFILGFLLGLHLARAKSSKLDMPSPELIDTIAFKYSDDPTAHGWRITQDDPKAIQSCGVKLQSDSEVGQYVQIEAEKGVRFEYLLQPSAFAADRFELQYKPHRSSAFYVRCHACGKGSEDHYWIQYQMGRDKPQPFGASKGREWTVYKQPSVLNGNWLILQCDVVGDFNATFGRDGLEFDHFGLFRARGHLNISAIKVYSVQRRGAVTHA